MGKTKVICFANNKGGSGKSTTCSNVGYGLRELGRKVLLIDGDMQLNLSLSLLMRIQYSGLLRGRRICMRGSSGRMICRIISYIHPTKDWI